MPLALVTGTRLYLGPAAATLGRAGFEVTTWEAGAAGNPSGPFDCYVQLPCAVTAPSLPPAAGTGGGGQAPQPGRRATDDLVCRTDALAAVADRLKPNASILLAVDEPDSSDAQHRTLPSDLLAAVALALLEDLDRPTSRLAVVPLAAFATRTTGTTQHDAVVAAAQTPVDAVLDLTQWEMPTPPLVSAP
jgi:hypothetical protein